MLQSLSRVPSIGESVQTRTVCLHKACGGQRLKQNKRHIFWHSSWCLFSDSANNISGRPTLLSCLCRNALQEDHCGDYLSPWSGWSLGHIGALGTRVLFQLPPSPLEGLQLSEFLSLRRCPIARGGVGLYLQCWRKDRPELCRFRESPRTDWTGKGHGFHESRLGEEEIIDSSLPKSQILWPTRTADGAKS